MTGEMKTHCGVIAILLSAFTVGCEQGDVQVQTPPPAPVNVIVPVQREVQDYDEFTGRVAAVDSIEVRSQVSGYIQKINFKDGDEVTKGQVLFEIDPRPYMAQLNQAKASLLQAQAELEYAKREYERLEPLAKNGIASPTEIAKAADMVARGNASIAMANANIEARQLDVNYASVVSPIAGRASKAKLSIGNLVTGNTPLTNVVSISPVYVDIDVDERRLLAYRDLARKKGTDNVTHIRDAKLPVFVALANEEGFPHQGVVVFADNQVDPLTGTIRVRAEVENPGNLFTPGQFLKVRIPRGEPQQSLIVPDRAIGRDQDRKYVLAVNDKSVVEYREVATGGQFADGRAISKGLTAGERIILDGLQRARPGQPVTATLLAPTTQPSTAK